MPFENDGVITWELLVERINADLANTLGNLVNRTISMSNKYFGGVVTDKGASEEVDDDLKSVVCGAYDKVEKLMDNLRVADALSEIFTVFKRLNKYIDETEPWVLAKDEAKQDRLATVLYNLTEGIIMGASLLAPFLPETGERIAAQLNTSLRDFDTLHEFGLYPSGNKVTDAPEILFARLDKEETLAKAEAIQARQREEFLAHQKKARENLVKAGRMSAEEAKALEQAENPAAGEEAGIDIEAKPEITFDDFEKLQFQVGEIIACEAVEKSKKLLCSQVRIGSQVKQIVSGLRKYYSPEEMVGKKVMVLVNLKPAKLAGVLSEGMLLCAEDAEGNLALLTPEKNMPSGAEIA
jgi:methionyl-tRNA synthetase